MSSPANPKEAQKGPSKQAYSRFLRNLDMKAILLHALRFDVNREALPAVDAGGAMSVSVGQEVAFLEQGHGLCATVTYTLTAKAPGGRRPFAKAKVTFDVVFSLDKGTFEADYHEPLRRNVVFITWPYLRETIDSLSSRAAIPIPSAPLLA